MKERSFQARLARRLDLSTARNRLKVFSLYAILLLCGAPISRGQYANFTITNFSNDMSLSGTCLVDEGTSNQLWMTAARNDSQSISAAVDSACKAVYNTTLRIYDPDTGVAASWNTSFTFTISPQSDALPGEYMAFAITANKTVGSPSAAGLYDDNVFPTNGNPNIQVVAVRFFTYWNNVSLLVNDEEDSRNWNLDKYNVSLNKAYDRMRTYQAWIDYDGSSKTIDFYIVALDVSATKSLASLVFSEVLDLGLTSTHNALLPSDSYIGFTAATTVSDREIHEITSWQFSHRVSNSSVLSTPGSTPTSTGTTSSKSSKSSNLGLIVGVCIGAALIVLALLVIRIVLVRRKTKSPHQKVKQFSPSHLDAVNFGPQRFTYTELRFATDDFSDKRLLGKGGFGSVYQGSLPGSKESVAIKRISETSAQGEREFEAEVLSIGRLRHRNLVPLLGWCHEQEELLLVYEFMANGSLDHQLYPKNGNATLSWESRLQILKSVAAALNYLHSGWEQCILHRDIKPSNVLLDSQMNARLGDFGLARAASHTPDDETAVMTHLTDVVGTIGYIAPVSNCYQAFTTKTDVYSFGMMALEVVCGRPPLSRVKEEAPLVQWVWSMHEKGQLLGVIDASLQMDPQFKSDEASQLQLQQIKSVLHLGMLCTTRDSRFRPRTERLLQALKGDWSVSLPAPSWEGRPTNNTSTSTAYNTSSSDFVTGAS